MSSLLFELHSRERTLQLYLRWIRDRPQHKDADLWRERVAHERHQISTIINILIPNEDSENDAPETAAAPVADSQDGRYDGADGSAVPAFY